MREFRSNYSSLGDKHKILLKKDLMFSILEQARIILIPFFREISLDYVKNEKGNEYPKLTSLAESILESVFHDGSIDIESEEEAIQVANKFIKKLSKWKKKCLIFYFCSDEIVLNLIEEQINAEGLYEDENMTLEDIYVEEGRKFQIVMNELEDKDEELASYLVKELFHLQDIYSIEDLNSWDAGSILNANENFQEYAGKDQTLIPLKIDEYDYWEKIMGNENDY
jgi:hypothetical protein